MAAPKTTPVYPPAFSTILSAWGTDHFIRRVVVLDPIDHDPELKRTQGIGRTDCDHGLFLRLHGALQ